jgi:hypothetical protein
MDIDEYIKRHNELTHIAEAQGKELILEGFKAFFEAHPNVDAVRWTQYAPSFNDGDPCVFSVHDPEVRYVTDAEGSSKPDQDEDDEDDEDEDDEDEDGFDPYPEIESPILDKIWALPASFFETVFGDGSQVTITRDLFVEVEEYGDY